MGRISLEGLEFFAYHGYYDEEQKIGNKYAVDLYVEVDFSKAAEKDQLTGTVDYEALYKIVKKAIAKPSRLLEHIGAQIIDATIEAYPQIKLVEVKVSKFNPPIGGVCHRAAVSMQKER